jgi:putative lipoic acid-binding regulatory protein
MAKDPKLPTDPTELAAALAELPPAERFEALIEFPTDHTFKVIGAADQAFVDGVRAALADLGFPAAALGIRYSSGQKYVSITIELPIETGARLAAAYEKLTTLPGVQYVL